MTAIPEHMIQEGAKELIKKTRKKKHASYVMIIRNSRIYCRRGEIIKFYFGDFRRQFVIDYLNAR